MKSPTDVGPGTNKRAGNKMNSQLMLGVVVTPILMFGCKHDQVGNVHKMFNSKHPYYNKC